MMKEANRFVAGALALLALLLSACGAAGSAKAPLPGLSGKAAEPPRSIVIVEADHPEDEAAATPERPSAFLRRSLPEGRTPGSEGLAALLLELAANSEIEALILAPAPKGAAEAFRQVREARPGLLLLAAQPAEEPLLIQSSADLVAELQSPGTAATRALEEGLAELARRTLGKGARLDGLEDLLAALRFADPGLRWSVSYFVDPEIGLRARNQVSVEAFSKD